VSSGARWPGVIHGRVKKWTDLWCGRREKWPDLLGRACGAQALETQEAIGQTSGGALDRPLGALGRSGRRLDRPLVARAGGRQLDRPLGALGQTSWGAVGALETVGGNWTDLLGRCWGAVAGRHPWQGEEVDRPLVWAQGEVARPLGAGVWCAGLGDAGGNRTDLWWRVGQTSWGVGAFRETIGQTSWGARGRQAIGQTSGAGRRRQAIRQTSWGVGAFRETIGQTSGGALDRPLGALDRPLGALGRSGRRLDRPLVARAGGRQLDRPLVPGDGWRQLDRPLGAGR
jgi:hypothetical protein